MLVLLLQTVAVKLVQVKAQAQKISAFFVECQSVGTAGRENEAMRLDLPLRAAIALLPAETRLRLRHWLATAFDGCGNARKPLDRGTFIRYRATDFVRTDMRMLQKTGKARNRDLPPHRGGFYAIASDRDWLYVGKTVNLAHRRVNHAASLRHNNHSNALLQRHWNQIDGPMWFIVLELHPDGYSMRRVGEDPGELRWKRALRPIYDREPRKADISYLIHPLNGSPSSMWPGGPPTFPRSTSKAWGLPS